MIAYALPCPTAPPASRQPAVLAFDRSTHAGPVREDATERPRLVVDDAQAEVLLQIAAGRARFRGRLDDIADELPALGLACWTKTGGFRLTAAGRRAAEDINGGPVPQRWRRPKYRMPRPGRHAMWKAATAWNAAPRKAVRYA